MTERARRPILHLKLGGTSPDQPDTAPSGAEAPARPPRTPPAPQPTLYTWKCRPCGTVFTPPSHGPDDEAVRCPSCNARLGRAADFRLDPPPLERLRARAVKIAPPPLPPVTRPRTRPPVVTVKVLKKVR
jgi:DNA-directed RNA polymerase subunit RPC12/RpoP